MADVNIYNSQNNSVLVCLNFHNTFCYYDITHLLCSQHTIPISVNGWKLCQCPSWVYAVHST